MSLFTSAFETERILSDDAYALRTVPLGGNTRNTKQLIGLGILTVVNSVIGILALVYALKPAPRGAASSGSGGGFQPTKRVAFGSCSSYDLRPQPIWTDAIIPSKPDAWIWLGDMAYLDTSPVSCNTPATLHLPACNCTNGYIAYRGQCLAGNVDAARDRWDHAVHSRDYRAFLDYMCPPDLEAAAAAAPPAAAGLAGFAAAPGRFPPAGTDPSVCPRPIFGVYDDHDYGWNNGNRRLPNKAEFKRMFLDAVGEAPASSRRSADAGLQAVYTLNGGGPGRDIDLVLLDERWYRDTLPCSLRRPWCEGILAQPEPDDPRVAWCQDFLVDDGTTGHGSCCTKDDDMAVWCSLPSSRDSPLWPVACDPTSPDWGSRPLVLGPDNTTLLPVDDALWDSQVRELWPRLLQARDSPVCEVLGSAQRQWLSWTLARSDAALTLVASGSVLLGSVGWADPVQGACGGDDFNCWPPAQLALLHTLAATASGCVVVLTGDYHFADIKVVAPGNGTAYAERLQTAKINKHIYQVMASGMTDSTAHHNGSPCSGTYREDLVGLRPLGRCSYMDGPNFGMLEVDWEKQVAHLTIRDADGGGVAAGLDGAPQHVAFSLKTCAPVPV